MFSYKITGFELYNNLCSSKISNKNAGNSSNFLHFLVEATGFEPTTLWSRTIRATSCATPRFFSFLSIFVSGQTCGQATYFERFVEKCTARIVRFFKGFSDFQKSLLQDRWRCPERNALPTALRLYCFFLQVIFYKKR